MQGVNIKPQTYAPMLLQAGRNGLRNRLVHDYEAIDPSRVYGAIPVALDDLTQLQQAVATQVRI